MLAISPSVVAVKSNVYTFVELFVKLEIEPFVKVISDELKSSVPDPVSVAVTDMLWFLDSFPLMNVLLVVKVTVGADPLYVHVNVFDAEVFVFPALSVSEFAVINTLDSVFAVFGRRVAVYVLPDPDMSVSEPFVTLPSRP